MPKSKRDKQISLTKTKKVATKAHKEGLVSSVRECIEEYKNVFVFSVQNMRSTKLIAIRQEMKADSRMLMGKRKVMILALGKSTEAECAPNIHKLGKYLVGQTGLLFTNRSAIEVKKQFAAYSIADYARAGNIVNRTVTLPMGPLKQFPFNIEPQLRKLGMPTHLDKGVVALLQDFTVCTDGDALTPEQAKILKLLHLTLIDFKVQLLCCWQKKNGGSFKSFVKKSCKKVEDNDVEMED
jgi:mRNA turnover protein 4